jgi:hypothetical protein
MDGFSVLADATKVECGYCDYSVSDLVRCCVENRKANVRLRGTVERVATPYRMLSVKIANALTILGVAGFRVERLGSKRLLPRLSPIGKL